MYRKLISLHGCCLETDDWERGIVGLQLLQELPCRGECWASSEDAWLQLSGICWTPSALRSPSGTRPRRLIGSEHCQWLCKHDSEAMPTLLCHKVMATTRLATHCYTQFNKYRQFDFMPVAGCGPWNSYKLFSNHSDNFSINPNLMIWLAQRHRFEALYD